MPELIDAKTAAERTLNARNRALEEYKTCIINKIHAAISQGKYYMREIIPDYWNIKEFESFWYFFADKGYELSIAGITDFAEASELYITKGFTGLTIYWGDTF